MTHLNREEVEDSLKAVLLDNGNMDYNLGALSALYHLVDTAQEGAEDLQQELVTAMVYQQTMKYTKQTTDLSNLTNFIARKVGIPQDKLEKAGKTVQDYIVAEQTARKEAANETQQHDGEQD